MPIPLQPIAPPPVVVPEPPPPGSTFIPTGGTPETTPPQVVAGRGGPIWTLEFERDGVVVTFLMSCGRGFGYRSLAGTQGVDMPPVEIFTSPLPDGPGSILRGWRYNERELFFPIAVQDANYAATRERMRVLWYMVRGGQPVTVRLREPEGRSRTASAYYVSGLEGEYGGDNWSPSLRNIGLTFRAIDPFWYGAEESTEWQLNPSLIKPFLSTTMSFFPVVFTNSAIDGRRTLVNSGDEPASPVIHVTGPGQDLSVKNITTGRSLTLSGVVASDETITIDTRRGQQDVYNNFGENLWKRVGLGSALWALTPGSNVIEILMANLTDNSRVSMLWAPRYLTGH